MAPGGDGDHLKRPIEFWGEGIGGAEAAFKVQG